MLVQTFRTEAAVECFDEETISRLAGAYEVASVRLGASFHRGSGSCLRSGLAVIRSRTFERMSSVRITE